MIRFRGQLYREALAITKISIQRDHILTRPNPPLKDLPPNAKKWLQEWQALQFGVDSVVLATIDDELVGFVRYDMDESAIFAVGTWVAPAHRRRGIGKQMWEYLIEHEHPARVDVFVTRNSERLFSTLMKEFPEIAWT